jgi:hypothetical protein
MEPLCQRGGASCGACCGLYNLRDFSRRAVRHLLARSTAALRRAARTPEAYRAAATLLSEQVPAPLFPSVRVCPLLGFLGDGETRVGCLAHPLSTGGADLRDCGVYDARTCDTFFCPSHSWLSEAEAEIAAAVCSGDPYLYGLVVTDVVFLRAALDGIARLTGARVERRHLRDVRFGRALKGLLRLKEELAPGSEGLFGAFRPVGATEAGSPEPGSEGGAGDPVARRIDYAALDRNGSPYDTILLCVGADPRSGNDLDDLEAQVRARLAACASAFP